MHPLSWRRRLASAALAAALSLCLPACKDSGGSSTNSSTGPSTAPAATTAPAGAASSAAAKFDKPLKPNGPISIEIITNNSSPFWSAMEKGMNDAVPTLPGCDAKRVLPPGAQPSNNDQKNVFEQAVAAKKDGIAVTPIEAEAFTPVINDAINQGIPVICYDSDAPTSERLAYLGTNNYEAGKRAGEQAVKLLPKGGSYIAFVGNMSAQNARDRYKGFQDAVQGHNFKELQAPSQDKADKAMAIRNVQDALTRYGSQIDLCVGLWSYNGPGIVKVVKEHNLRNKIKIVCFDGDPQTLQYLQSGDVDAAVIQKPYEFGRLSTILLYNINRKGFTAAMNDLKPELDKLGMTVKGNIIDTGVEVVTPTNAAPFIQKLKAKGLETT